MILTLRQQIGILSPVVLLTVIVLLPTMSCIATFGACDESINGTTFTEQKDDEWRFGYRSESWKLIEAIQSYPLCPSKEPNWSKYSQDDDPYVRAAVALAIARKRDVKLITVLDPLLFDEFPLTRKCAMWALLRMDDPAIKDPLLDVIGSWDNLGGDLFVETDNILSFLFERLGLPTRLLATSLLDRLAHLEKLDVSTLHFTPKKPDPRLYTMGDGRTQITACLEKSCWDAGDQPKIHMLALRPDVRKDIKGKIIDTPTRWVVVKPNGKIRTFIKALKGRMIDGRGRWYAVTTNGKIRNITDFDDRRIRFDVKSDIVTWEPGVNTQIETKLKTPTIPGVYLLNIRNGYTHLEYFLARVQRSESFEKTIPDLLENMKNPGTIKLLGQQRVKAAIPKLIEIFRENGTKSDNPINFRIADAFAQILDPRAIPVLLEYPHLRDWDVGGDTSRALREFGHLAYPHYEQQILAWENTLTRYLAATKAKTYRDEPSRKSPESREMFALEMSLRLLGPNGSKEVDQARLNLVNRLTRELENQKYKDDLPVLVVFRAAVLATVPIHPQHTVEVIWNLRSSSGICSELISELRMRNPEVAKPICSVLWENLKNEPQEYPEFKRLLQKTLSQIAPELLTEGAP